MLGDLMGRVRLYGVEALVWAEAHAHTNQSFIQWVKDQDGKAIWVEAARKMGREEQSTLYVDVLANKCYHCGLHYPEPTWSASFADAMKFHGCLRLKETERIARLENRCLQLERRVEQLIRLLEAAGINEEAYYMEQE